MIDVAPGSTKPTGRSDLGGNTNLESILVYGVVSLSRSFKVDYYFHVILYTAANWFTSN